MSGSASVLIVMLALVAVGYVAVGVQAAILYDVVIDGGTDGWAEAGKIVAGWPPIAFTALAGLYAMWATQRELDKL